MKKKFFSPQYKQGAIYFIVTLILYVLAFSYLEEIFGLRVLAFAIFPVLMGSWRLGIEGGLFASLLSVLLSILILSIKGHPRPFFIFLREGLIGTLVLFSLAIVSGYLARMEQRSKAAIARSNELIHALTHVATERQASSTPEEVMDRMGAALKEIGLDCMVALLMPASQSFAIRYTSLDEKLVRKFERLAKTADLNTFRFSVEELPAYLTPAENKNPVILSDYVLAIASMLPGFTEEMIRRILPPEVIMRDKTLGHFPLFWQEKYLGFLWLWGEDIAETDLPALSLFADQIAVALENAHLFEKLQRLAITDTLTNIYNRRHFFKLAFEEYYRSKRYQHPLSLIMLDLDLFKDVNDAYGHVAGDIVLNKIATLCKDILRAEDIIGRYGGEEVVILLPETNFDAACKVAERLRQEVEDFVISTPKGDVQLTISGGVAGDDVETLNLIDMIELADQALYIAKESGRNSIEFASSQEVT